MYTRAMKREPELPYYVLMSDINYLSGSSNFVTSYRSIFPRNGSIVANRHRFLSHRSMMRFLIQPLKILQKSNSKNFSIYPIEHVYEDLRHL